MRRKETYEERHPIYENVQILDAGSEGKAVGKIEGKVVFVPYAMPGDIADIQIIKKNKGYLEGKVIRFRSRPKEVRTPFCGHFGMCGGCKWQHMPYELQLQYKQKQVMDNLTRIGKVEAEEARPILGSIRETHYRNKLEFTFSSRKWLMEKPEQGVRLPNTNGLGFHMPGMFDRIIDLEKCYLQPEPSDEIRMGIRAFALRNDWSFRDARAQEGFLRNLILRNNRQGHWMVILVFSKNDKAKIQAMMEYIEGNFPMVKSLMYVVNPKKNDDISDLEVVLHAGQDYLEETLGGLKFRIGPKSFFQTNTNQAETLYGVVKEFAALTGNEVVYDLYSGTGTIGLTLAGEAKKVIGIEYVAGAVEDAQLNAAANGITNATFIQGDMARAFSEELLSEHGRPDVVVLDPPRAGLAPRVLESLLDTRPPRIVYVSCNPATQARDLSFLCDLYHLRCVQPVDMFPQTHHVENVALLELM
ncbi:MAG TPA: 23S rRNA (uracil(1939)-C(5))-methyltransferase RlmD [Bacteroidales bacterium]|nr:23S rRNA (uracil(1939)-C(5))-methyltransferase RlmD [Bacteroidales bacterium]